MNPLHLLAYLYYILFGLMLMGLLTTIVKLPFLISRITIKLINNRAFLYLILPIVILVGVGIILHHTGFAYIEQYVIACGPVISAIVAWYITSSTEHKEKIREKFEREVQLDHALSCVKEGINAIDIGINCYNEYSEFLKENNIVQIPFGSTSFYFLEEAILHSKVELYSSLLKSNEANKQLLKEAYINIISNVEYAVSVKKNAREHYGNYIALFNEKARDWKNIYLDFIGLGKVMPNNSFGIKFVSIVNSYINRVGKKELNRDLIGHIRDNLIFPLQELLETKGESLLDEHYYNIQDVIYRSIVVMDKIEELNTKSSSHFKGLNLELKDCKKNIEKGLEMIRKNL